MATKPPPKLLNKLVHESTRFWLAGLLVFILLLLYLPFYQPKLQFSYPVAALSKTLENATTSGFYEKQIDQAGNNYVWTSERPGIFFDFHTSESVKLVVWARSAAVAGGINAPVSVLVNGVEITQFQPDPTKQDFQPFEFILPGTSSDMRLQMVTRTFTAPGDSRTLGTMISSVTLDKTKAWDKLKNRVRLLWLVAALLVLAVIVHFVPFKSSSVFIKYRDKILFAGAFIAAGLALGFIWSVGPVDQFYFGLITLVLVCTMLATLALINPLANRLTLKFHPKAIAERLLSTSAFLLLLIIAVSNLPLLWGVISNPKTTRFAAMSYQERQTNVFGTFAEGVNYADKLISVDAPITVILPNNLYSNGGVSFFFNYWLYPRRIVYEQEVAAALSHNNTYLLYTCSFELLQSTCSSPLPNLLGTQNRYTLVRSFEGNREFFGIYRLNEVAISKVRMSGI
ncbi:MAG: hypothetical protein HXX08_07780 [Chloroflexi bacterium]|uniref:Uncharacterized protein n=1 Tax=Candidatus Chlorohelix allophototropha TaxID=3003348 RepID=A0A8T7LXS2_9CHLR|nr:hypothetical protein [Chloroflexota bacterium]WJW67631.1 hypothetical protein OZ401_000901 [Chloroflexota bacterium L227-S17]